MQNRLQISEQGTKSGVVSASLEGSDPVLLSATLNEIGKEYVRQNVNQKSMTAEKSLNYLELQLPTAKHHMEQAEDKLQRLSQQSRSSSTPTRKAGSSSRQANDADSRLFDLKRQRQDLTARFSPTHPSVVAIDEQIAATNEYIETLAVTREGHAGGRAGCAAPDAGRAREHRLYSALRNNVETLQLIKAGKSASVQLIDAADVPERPVKPVKSLVY